MGDTLDPSRKFILSLDVGSTTIRCHVLNELAVSIGAGTNTVTELYPEVGRVEIDPVDLWNKIKSVVDIAILKTMASDKLENLNPKLFKKSDDRKISAAEEDDSIEDEFDEREIFDLIRSINDPEHPLSLEELDVVKQSLIKVDNEKSSIEILFTPTIPHCSMATLIGLSIRVQLIRSLPSRFKVKVEITPGTHASESAVNKQLADKERVAAALENINLLQVINQCIASTLS